MYESLVWVLVGDFDDDTQARVVRMLDLLGDNAPPDNGDQPI